MLEQHLKDNNDKSLIKVLERSIFSARYCFIENLYQRLVTNQEITSFNLIIYINLCVLMFGFYF